MFKKIIIMLIVVLISPSVIYANDYDSINTTYVAHTPTTYTVGSGCSADTIGVTCYSGTSYEHLLSDHNPVTVFYKDDIIEFIPDTTKSSSVTGGS